MNEDQHKLIESARAEELKNHAVEFANRIKGMFPIMTVENGQWVIESQISTEQLYDHLFNPKV